MSAIMIIEVKFTGGERITDACVEACCLATKLGCWVEFMFNDVRCSASPNSDPAQLAEIQQRAQNKSATGIQYVSVHSDAISDADRDYADMRKFQGKYIASDHRVRALEAVALEIYEANTQLGYHNMWPAIAKLFELIGKRKPTPPNEPRRAGT